MLQLLLNRLIALSQKCIDRSALIDSREDDLAISDQCVKGIESALIRLSIFLLNTQTLENLDVLYEPWNACFIYQKKKTLFTCANVAKTNASLDITAGLSLYV